MVARVVTVAFEGVEARRVDVEVQLMGAVQPRFAVVGLADKAVAESRERVAGPSPAWAWPCRARPSS
jgi:magnesium chelatase family protein